MWGRDSQHDEADGCQPSTRDERANTRACRKSAGPELQALPAANRQLRSLVHTACSAAHHSLDTRIVGATAFRGPKQQVRSPPV